MVFPKSLCACAVVLSPLPRVSVQFGVQDFYQSFLVLIFVLALSWFCTFLLAPKVSSAATRKILFPILYISSDNISAELNLEIKSLLLTRPYCSRERACSKQCKAKHSSQSILIWFIQTSQPGLILNVSWLHFLSYFLIKCLPGLLNGLPSGFFADQQKAYIVFSPQTAFHHLWQFLP